MVAPVMTMTPEEFLDFDGGAGYELIDGCPVERAAKAPSGRLRRGLECAGWDGLWGPSCPEWWP